MPDIAMTINDAHCHFFSTQFFTTLAAQRGRGESSEAVCAELAWEHPGPPEALASRWVRELDAHGVARAVAIASVPGDEASVEAAVRASGQRLVGFCMVDPSAPDAVARASRVVLSGGVRGLCLFPAMSRVPLDDPRCEAIVSIAAEHSGTAVFVHCGLLSVGVRKKLGLPSRFDLRLGDPLAVARLAASFPRVPFIIPHFGAGLFRETLMAADACPNIHLDTSSSNGWTRFTPSLSLETVFRTAIDIVGPKRLIFGTDSSFFPRGWQRTILDQQVAIFDALDLDGDARALVLGGNFDRLFPTQAI